MSHNKQVAPLWVPDQTNDITVNSKGGIRGDPGESDQKIEIRLWYLP